MKKRIGILTSSSMPGLNATIRGVAKALYQRMGDDVQIVGITNGYSGLINGQWREMEPEEFSGILTMGGTIFGHQTHPLQADACHRGGSGGQGGRHEEAEEMKLDCLLCLGGNGTHKTAVSWPRKA